MDWKATFREYVNMDPSLLYNIATNSADEIQYTLEVYFGYSRSKRFTTQIFASFASADDRTTQKEYELFRRVTDTLFDEYYSYSEFCDIVNDSYDCDYVKSVMPIARQNDDLRDAIIRLGLAMCAIDDTITAAEQNFVAWFGE